MSIQSIIQSYSPAGKLLLLFGLFLFCLGIATLAQILILFPFADMNSLDDVAALSDFSNPRLITGMKLAQGISAIITFIIPAFLFAYFSSENKFSYLKTNKSFSTASGVAVLLLVFTAMPIINWMGELNSHLTLPAFLSEVEEWMKTSEDSLKKLTEEFLKMDTVGDLLINIIVIALLAAVGEELLFRGAMQNVFLEWTRNSHVAVWITAILFSALHAQFYGFLPRMMLGVVLGYLYIWSGSLWLPILLHFLNNGLSVLFSYLVGKGMISDAAETIGTGETPMIYVITSFVISIGLMLFIYREAERSKTANTEQPNN